MTAWRRALEASPYSVLMVLGILTTALLWRRVLPAAKRADGRLTAIYFVGLFAALLGAKLAFLLAEGWHYREDWLALLSGRSVTGALLGGYVGVELAKKRLRFASTTGDLFAIAVPVGLVFGRVGCILEGCCGGRVLDEGWLPLSPVDDVDAHRWPAAEAEWLFNALFLLWAIAATRRGWQPGNRFHVYLMAYGLFRFAHEFLRDTARLAGPLSGYQLIAAALFGLGLWRYRARRGAPVASRK